MIVPHHVWYLVKHSSAFTRNAQYSSHPTFLYSGNSSAQPLELSSAADTQSHSADVKSSVENTSPSVQRPGGMCWVGTGLGGVGGGLGDDWTRAQNGVLEASLDEMRTPDEGSANEVKLTGLFERPVGERYSFR